MRKNNKNKGFTLVELLIVVAIIGILAAVLTPQFLNARKVAVDKAAQAFAHNMYTAVQAVIAEGETWTATECATVMSGNNYIVGNYSVPVPSGGFVISNCKIEETFIQVDYSGGINPAPGTNGIQVLVVPAGAI